MPRRPLAAGLRQRRDQQRRRGRARVLVPDAALAQIAGPALAGLQRHGRQRALARPPSRAAANDRCRRRARPPPAPARPASSCRPARPRRAAPPRPPRRAARRASCSARHLGRVAERLARAAQQRPVQRPGGAADRRDQLPPGQDRARRRACRGGSFSSARGHGREPALQVAAVVGVADRGVQLGEPVRLAVHGTAAVAVSQRRKKSASSTWISLRRERSFIDRCGRHGPVRCAARPGSAAPAQPRRPHRRVPQPQQLLVDLAQGHRGSPPCRAR